MLNQFNVSKYVDVVEFKNILTREGFEFDKIYRKDSVLFIETIEEYTQADRDQIIVLINDYTLNNTIGDVQNVKKNTTITPGFYEITYEELETPILRPGVYRFEWKFKFTTTSRRITVQSKVYINDQIIEEYIQTPYEANDLVVISDFEYITLESEQSCKIRLDVKQLTSKGAVQFKKFAYSYQRLERE